MCYAPDAKAASTHPARCSADLNFCAGNVATSRHRGYRKIARNPSVFSDANGVRTRTRRGRDSAQTLAVLHPLAQCLHRGRLSRGETDLDEAVDLINRQVRKASALPGLDVVTGL